MKNHWILPRNKRTLWAVPQVLSVFNVALNRSWSGNVDLQLEFESLLEKHGLKRTGTRRDQRGSGARTYEAWLACLGLVFSEDATGTMRLTLAGEHLLAGAPPVDIITNQLMRFQFPSSYSIRSNVNISRRFQVHPFRFIISLLNHPEIEYLTQEEIALFVVTEAVSDDADCLGRVAGEILRFRRSGNDYSVLPADFAERYPSRVGQQDLAETVSRLNDNANTFINFLEYTGLAARDEDRLLRIIDPDRVDEILSQPARLISSPTRQENFQRNYGLPPGMNRDNRQFTGANVTAQHVQEALMNFHFLRISSTRLINVLDNLVVDEVSQASGCNPGVVRNYLARFSGSERDLFASEYVGMAFAGRDDAIEFERATASLFGPVGIGFESRHIGGPSNPDIEIAAPELGRGIIDAKAYSTYAVSNDHRNRMLVNYIPSFQNNETDPLLLFLYVAGGFRRTFNGQIASMAQESGLNGCGITAANALRLADYCRRHQSVTVQDVMALFSINREVLAEDIEALI
jgi:hypothetical protein